MIQIHLREEESGYIFCDAVQTSGNKLSHIDVMTVVGMLETAKMSLLAGRWGVMDAEKKEVRGFAELTEGYERKAPEAHKEQKLGGGKR